MQIPNGATVLVADGRKMLLLQNEGDADFPNLTVMRHEERVHHDERDFSTDSPGSTFSGSAGGGVVGGNPGSNNRSGYEQTDFHQLEEDRFAADCADMLNRLVLGNRIGGLIVVAPPKALGELRKHYHKQTEALLIGEIAKDLTGRPTDEIEKLISAS